MPRAAAAPCCARGPPGGPAAAAAPAPPPRRRPVVRPSGCRRRRAAAGAQEVGAAPETATASPPRTKGRRPRAATRTRAAACPRAAARPAVLAPAAFVVAGLPAGAGALDLDPCSSKPTFRKGWCAAGDVLACWTRDAATPWRCWGRAWSPAWALTDSAARANAECMALEAPASGPGLAGFPPLQAPRHFDGACTLEEPTRDDVVVDDFVGRQLPWEEARRKAEATVRLMSSTEKRMLLAGTGWDGNSLRKWWYVWNTPPIPRLGVPSLNMQDSASGFRTYWTELVGTVTCWPSMLALAATWDPATVRDVAEAIGDEFVGKGANGILGPSVNVHRVARNGRNFEYLSGEDPYLGAVLTKAYVAGVQSRPLIAVVKHWVFNEQETNRGTESSEVDSKTAWEIYYPPFQAAIDAGVDAFMCGQNRVNGVYACSSAPQLGVLKDQMGFQGFIQSDYGSSHGTNLEEGLDQAMPGPGAESFSASGLASQDPVEIDNSVVRILSAVYRADLPNTTKCSPPNCEAWMRKNVTSARHAALARSVAAESAVLLRNQGDVLPLRPSRVRTIAVVGAAAKASPYDPNGAGQTAPSASGWEAWNTGDIYSGGGSGHVAAGYVISAVDGITWRAAEDGIRVVSSPTDDADAAAEAAKQADVAIVVAGAWSAEARDRENLSLGATVDALIRRVAQACPRTVVLLEVPGAVLMPWRDAVQAIFLMFNAGQESGNAWADVLFGDRAPTGRLPLMLPATEGDSIPPGGGKTVAYTERMETSYRSTSFKAAYPFGHGLAYTRFEYLDPSVVGCGVDLCVEVRVRNVGRAPGRAVAQLYLDFPMGAGLPAPFLKGFQRTAVLLPRRTGVVTFRLTDRDLSYYNSVLGTFEKVSAATALIGESSADIRQRLPLMEARDDLWVDFLDLIIFICALAMLLMLVHQFGLLSRERTARRKLLNYAEHTDEEPP